MLQQQNAMLATLDRLVDQQASLEGIVRGNQAVVDGSAPFCGIPGLGK